VEAVRWVVRIIFVGFLREEDMCGNNRRSNDALEHLLRRIRTFKPNEVVDLAESKLFDVLCELATKRLRQARIFGISKNSRVSYARELFFCF